MSEIKIGQTAPNVTYQAANKSQIKLSDKLKEADKTFLIFSRYIGCPFCQVDIMELCEDYSRFIAAKVQIILVLQSTADIVRSQTLVPHIPYDIACDPEMKLYEIYGVKTAASMGKMLRPNKQLFHKTGMILKKKLRHGAYEGNEHQLPALFLLDKEGKVIHAHYASSVTDLPDVNGMLRLL